MDIDTLSIVFLQQFRNPILDAFSVFFNFLFSYIIVLGIVLVAYLILRKKRNFFPMLMASISTFVLSYIIKIIVARPRPGLELSGLILGANDSLSSVDYSFPSAHAAISFTIAVMLSRYYPKYRVLFYSIAVFASITRIYSGVHYLSDVIAGSVLGALVGYIVLVKEKDILEIEAKIHKRLKTMFRI
jgi:undecaprenyl-diphosphatase